MVLRYHSKGSTRINGATTRGIQFLDVRRCAAWQPSLLPQGVRRPPSQGETTLRISGTDALPHTSHSSCWVGQPQGTILATLCKPGQAVQQQFRRRGATPKVPEVKIAAVAS
jgi:hypothetical protein